MAVKKRTKQILARLDEAYGTEHICYLNHNSPWQLLVAVILSAQCTDARVNMVTPGLFQKYDSLEKLAEADYDELKEEIRSIGFFNSKAKNLIACARRLVTVYGGKVPSSIEDLTSLAGVGRKTANVIRGNIFHEPSIVVDTHVKRISKRLGFTDQEEPEKVEQDLMKELPKDHWIIYNMQIITLGRTTCTARSPKCSECFLSDLCDSKS